MIWEATMKPVAVSPTAGDVKTIRVKADDRESAVKEARFHAFFERCADYAITRLEVVKP